MLGHGISPIDDQPKLANSLINENVYVRLSQYELDMCLMSHDGAVGTYLFNKPSYCDLDAKPGVEKRCFERDIWRICSALWFVKMQEYMH